MIVERYKLWSSSLWSLLHSPFSILGLNILLKILFSKTVSLHSSLNIRDHVSQPYSTIGNIIVLYVLIIKFFAKNPSSSQTVNDILEKSNIFSHLLTAAFTYFQTIKLCYLLAGPWKCGKKILDTWDLYWQIKILFRRK